MGVRDHEFFRSLRLDDIDAERRGVVGTGATLKLYETAAGASDNPLVTLSDAHHWHVTRERLEDSPADVLVARITHDPSVTPDETMVKVDRLKVENAAGLTDLSGLLMTATVVQWPSGVGREWVIRGEEVTAGAR